MCKKIKNKAKSENKAKQRQKKEPYKIYGASHRIANRKNDKWKRTIFGTFSSWNIYKTRQCKDIFGIGQKTQKQIATNDYKVLRPIQNSKSKHLFCVPEHLVTFPLSIILHICTYPLYIITEVMPFSCQFIPALNSSFRTFKYGSSMVPLIKIWSDHFVMWVDGALTAETLMVIVERCKTLHTWINILLL